MSSFHVNYRLNRLVCIYYNMLNLNINRFLSIYGYTESNSFFIILFMDWLSLVELWKSVLWISDSFYGIHYD